MLVFSTTFAGFVGIGNPQIIQIPALIGAILLALPLLYAAFLEVKSARLSSSALAAVAILAALANGNYETAGLLAFILVIFGQFVRRSATGAQRAIAELVGLTPDIARIVENGAEKEVALSQVKVGSLVRVRAGENLPVDGRIKTCRSSLNQDSRTGETAPFECETGELV
ncbi:MAG: hypothetical protein ACK58T_13795, partial [Phycisphaerae bacterium]